MGIISDYKNELKAVKTERALAKDDDGWITIAVLGIVAGVSLLSTYYLTKPVGEGIGDAFTLFGQEIASYVVIGIVILGAIFLWLVFGRK